MLLRTAFRNLQRNKRRTFTVVLTVALGVGSLFSFHGFNTGIMNQYRDNTIRARYGHGQINTRGYRDQAHAEPWMQWIMDWSDIAPEIDAIPGVEQLFPRVEFSALLTRGDVTVSGRGQGIDAREESTFFITLNIVEGEMLSDQPDGLLLGQGLAQTLDTAIGDRVLVAGNTINGTLSTLDLEVIGIFHTGLADFDNTIFRVPLERALELLDTDRLESVALGLDSDESWEAVAQTIESRFTDLEAVAFSTLDEIYYQHSVDWLASQFGVIQIIIVLIVVLGILNSVSTGILERKQEIGNLRANGESSWDIMVLLASEGLFLGVLGSLLGCALALLINMTVLRQGIAMPPAPGLTREFFVLIELQPVMALQTCAMGIGSTMVGTLLAGSKVSRMPIGAALRSA